MFVALMQGCLKVSHWCNHSQGV